MSSLLLLAAVLSVVMGLALGLLGGGGSILTVPILIYALGVGTKEAIATSLLVVGFTSVAGMLQHARSKNVEWKTGLVFGAVAMPGAYAGGFVASWIPGELLLVLFAALMVVTAVVMLRGRKDVEPRPFQFGKLAVEGMGVGLVTGLVGAGGGFLVVPALVLLAGLSMRAAVGTSLLVVAMKSFAGLAGHLTHISIDLELAGVVTIAAVAGSFVGARMANRVPQAALRRGFAVFVLVMAAFVLYQQATPEILEAVFVTRWPFWVGGAAIGGFVLLLLWATDKPLGVSTGMSDACGATLDSSLRRSWRLPFLVGIAGGGLVAVLAGGGFAPSTAMGLFDAAFTLSLPVKGAVFLGGGVLVGFGARMAGGCTSGHGIVGVALRAPSSLLATGAFMASGFGVTHLVLRGLGGL